MYSVPAAFLLTFFLHSADVTKVILGFTSEDVILPCFFPPNQYFSDSQIHIFWRFKSEDIPVHYFFYEEFQTQFQSEKFRDRTMLFLKEFPKGNVSLLLKNIQVSDAGIYECSIVTPKYTSTNVELIVAEKTYGYSNKSSVMKISVFVVIFSIIVASCIFLRRRKRSRGRTGSMSTPSPESKKST